MNTATLADGVALDEASGRPIGYHISTMHPQSFVQGLKREWKLYEKGSSVTGSPLILHLYDQKRPELARGIPYLAPVIEAIKQLGDYSDAEVRAAVVSAMFTVFHQAQDRKRRRDAERRLDAKQPNIDPSTIETDARQRRVVDLEDGAEPVFADPTRPNANFDAFINAMAGQIGVALELPREVLLKSFTASYSASRAALEMAWQFFRMRRSWLAWKFCQPVYEWVITEAVARGRLAAPGYFDDPILREAWLGSDWIGPSHIQLDPLKEAKADNIDLANGTKTRTQIIVERTGGTFEGKVATRAEEERALKSNGIVLTPVGVNQVKAGAPGEDSPPPADGQGDNS
jgi:lambda family phage portal protein